MHEIEEIRVHIDHKQEMKLASKFLIDQGWATDPVVVMEEDSIWEELQKDSNVYGFLSDWKYRQWNFDGHRSHIRGKRWFDDTQYYWIVLRLSVNPDVIVSDPDTVDYIVIDREVLRLFSFEGMLEYLLKDF